MTGISGVILIATTAWNRTGGICITLNLRTYDHFDIRTLTIQRLVVDKHILVQ